MIGIGVLLLTYRLFLLHADRPTAVMVTFGLGITRLFYRYCFELLSALPFFLGVMAFLAGYQAVFRPAQIKESRIIIPDGGIESRTRWYDWALLLSGLALAIAMRPAMIALLLATGLALAWRLVRGRATWSHDGLLLAIMVIAVAGFYAFVDMRAKGPALEGGDYEYFVVRSLHDLGKLRLQIGENIRDLFPNAALIKALFGCKQPTPINVLMGVVIIGLAISLFRYCALWGFWATVTIGMLLLFKPLDRYFLPVIPLLVFAWWRLQFWLNHRLPLHWGNLFFLFLFLGGLGTNISRIGEMVVEQRRMPFLEHYHDSRYESAKKVAKLVRTKTEPHDCILAEPKVGRLMTFLADRDVFESTDAVPISPDRHLFALLGPSWEEGKEGRLKNGDPVRDWLTANGLQLGAQVGARIQGPHEPEPWVLYPVKPKPAENPKPESPKSEANPKSP